MLRKSSNSLILSVKLVASALLASPLLADPYSARTVSTGDYRITVARLSKTPITSYASSATLRTKINGPSLLRVPDWIRDPLGKYYLYFAHHDGKFIRLAYANAIQGPWSVYEPGTLRLEQATAFIGHIASPDVHVDEANRRILMYFHGSRENENQKTALATSQDGLIFRAAEEILGSAYFRVFQHENQYYAMDTHGFLNHSEYPDREWVRAEQELIAPIAIEDGFGRRDDLRIRHSATWVREDSLFLFFSRKSDAPERIMLSVVPLNGDWTTWRASRPIEIIRPEAPYEGIEFPMKPSKKGGGINRQELRDPYLFHDDDRSYLIYSVAGEMGLAIAEISIEEN